MTTYDPREDPSHAAAMVLIFAEALEGKHGPETAMKMLGNDGVNMAKWLRIVLAELTLADELRSYEQLSALVRRTPPSERWMMNEHVVRFEHFLTAYEAYKAGKPLPNTSSRQPGWMDMLRSWWK